MNSFNKILRNHNININKKNTKVSLLRKSRIFIKSRFSRNRQYCKPIVYWSIWFNVLFLSYSSAIFYGFKFSASYIPLTITSFFLLPILNKFLSGK